MWRDPLSDSGNLLYPLVCCSKYGCCNVMICRAAEVWKKVILYLSLWSGRQFGKEYPVETSVKKVYRSYNYMTPCVIVIVAFMSSCCLSCSRSMKRVVWYLSLWSGYGLPIISKEWTISDRNLHIATSSQCFGTHFSVVIFGDISCRIQGLRFTSQWF